MQSYDRTRKHDFIGWLKRITTSWWIYWIAKDLWKVQGILILLSLNKYIQLSTAMLGRSRWWEGRRTDVLLHGLNNIWKQFLLIYLFIYLRKWLLTSEIQTLLLPLIIIFTPTTDPLMITCDRQRSQINLVAWNYLWFIGSIKIALIFIYRPTKSRRSSWTSELLDGGSQGNYTVFDQLMDVYHNLPHSTNLQQVIII